MIIFVSSDLNNFGKTASFLKKIRQNIPQILEKIDIMFKVIIFFIFYACELPMAYIHHNSA